MPSDRRIHLLIFLALPSLVTAFNTINFAYIKNTQLGPCDPSKFPTDDFPSLYSNAAPASSPFAYTTQSLTTTKYCNSFWNYTVIPTLPSNSGFGFTWLSCLSNCISFLVSSFLLYLSTTSRPDKPPHLPPDSTFPGRRKILFQLSLIYDVFKTTFWWYSFYQLVRSSSTASRISLLQWITTYQYVVTVRDTLPDRLGRLRWLILALTLLQFGCCIYAAILMAKTTPLPTNGQSTLTTVTYQLTQDPFFSPYGISSPCSPTDAAEAVLLSDPVAPVRQLIYLIGSLIGVLLFIPSIVLELRETITRRSMLAAQMYAIGAVEGTMTLVMLLVQRRSTPLSWDDNCAVVHIMMSPNAGYWDVEIEQYWRIFKAFFNV